jgi:hypothetical protein
LRQFHQKLNMNDHSQPMDNSTELVRKLGAFLSIGEITAMGNRAGSLLESAHFPGPDPDRRHYPWPAV